MEIGNDEHQNIQTPKHDDGNQNDEHDLIYNIIDNFIILKPIIY